MPEFFHSQPNTYRTSCCRRQKNGFFCNTPLSLYSTLFILSHHQKPDDIDNTDIDYDDLHDIRVIQGFVFDHRTFSGFPFQKSFVKLRTNLVQNMGIVWLTLDHLMNPDG